MKKLVSMLIIAIMIISMAIPATTFASQNAQFTDISGHWAEKQIGEFATKGYISGYKDGSFKPNATIKRSELVSLVNRVFAFKDAAEVKFSDVQTTNWFYNDVAKAQKAGYISGYSDGTFKPENNITRAEMAVVVSKLLSLKPSDSADEFSDTANVSNTLKGYIGAVYDKGIMKGYGNKFNPNSYLTRAEATVILQSTLFAKAKNYDQPGTYGPETGIEKVNSDVVINVPGVTVKNMEIAGNLLIGEGVGEGDVFLKNVKVNGTTTVKGGGENSIHLEDTVMLTVVVDKIGGNVRIVVSGAVSSVQEVRIQSGARIESNGGANITEVTLAEALPQNSKVQLAGQFETVNVLAKSITIEIPEGTDVASLVLNAAVDIVGSGEIENATINSAGVTMEKAPKQTTIGNDVPSDVTVVIGGQTTPATQINEPTPIVGGGGGGGSIPVPSPSPEPTPAPDTVAPVISGITQDSIVWGDVLTPTVNEDSSIYFVKSQYRGTVGDLQEGVFIGGGKLVQAKANEPVQFFTDSNKITAGFYVLAAVDKAGNISNYVMLTVFEQNDKPFRIVETISNGVDAASFYFNKPAHFTDEATIKASVTVSVYDGAEFYPLADGDQIFISDNGKAITIKFAEGLYGNKTVVKFAARSVSDSDNVPSSEELLSGYIYSNLTRTILIDNGDGTFSIKSSKPAVVYLVEQSVPIENVISVGVRIDVTAADTPTLVPTQGLAPGTYKLVTIEGNILNNAIQIH